MDFHHLQTRALQIRALYEQLEMKRYGKRWSSEQIAQGFVGDVGDLLKLVLAKSGVRDMEEVDKKLAHELSDCLWCVIILANEYGVDLETVFSETMNQLEDRVKTKLQE